MENLKEWDDSAKEQIISLSKLYEPVRAKLFHGGEMYDPGAITNEIAGEIVALFMEKSRNWYTDDYDDIAVRLPFSKHEDILRFADHPQRLLEFLEWNRNFPMTYRR